MRNQDFVVRFAGEGGQGVVTSAEALAQAAAQVGYHVQTFSTFPSQIMGGPTWAQTRISTGPVLSAGDDLDILVAFNRRGYEDHCDEVRDGGAIVYNSGDFELESADQNIGIAIDELAKKTGNPRAANMVVLGALSHLVSMPESYLQEFIKARFSRGRPGDEEVIRANIMAISLGREEAASRGMQIGELAPPVKPEAEQILVKGNDAISLGAVAGGLECYIGYPISPATAILVFMERNLVSPGKFVCQSSSEIESINAVMGAGFAGRKAMTATSGPGFSLMGEGIGMGWMAEIPAVIVDVQRAGPGTGLPTKTEQSDLLTALSPGHGDMRMPVIAAGTVEECFYAIIDALNWAERYQGPVILLSETVLADRAQNIPKPDLSKVVTEGRRVYRGSNGYQRYDSIELNPMPIPGGPGAYSANASEHDGIGDTTHLATRHIQMTERRFGKLKLLEDGTYECENPEEPIAVMPWGGSKGPVREAYNRMVEQGQRLGWYYTMYLHPLPPKLLEELREKELVIVPELNYQGQFASVLRSLGVRAEAITQITGLPFRVRDLVSRVSERIESHQKRTVRT